MIVIFISECEKKSFKISARILNKYAKQIGRRTWTSRLSIEGLSIVKNELQARVSKNMSVTCHKIKGRNRTDLLWIVGTKKHFCRNGLYAFSWSKNDFLKEAIERIPLEKLLIKAIEFAGLLHDIGKTNAFFVDKLLKNQKISDPIRHEYVSILYFAKIIESTSVSGENEPMDDLNWLKFVADSKQLEDQLIEISRSECLIPRTICSKHLKNKGSVIFNFGFLLNERKIPPILFAIYWLILTHHKLPKGYYVEKSTSKCEKKDFGNWALQEWHINEERDDDEFLKCMRIKEFPPFYKDTNWINKLSDKAGEIKLIIEESKLKIDSSGFYQLIASYARTAIVIADFFVSSKKEEYKESGKEKFFANSINKTQNDQLLIDHLKEVGNASGSALRLFAKLQKKYLPSIDNKDLPATFREIPPKKFHWQIDAIEKVKNKKEIINSGFFGIILAGTGTGKTRAASKIMASLSDGLRYTLALGLRTLVLQAGENYKKELDLNKDVSIVIGSKAAQRLFELDTNDDKLSDLESSQNELEALSVTGEDDVDGLFPNILEFMDLKQRKMLKSPILITTVDQIISAADTRKNSHLLSNLRLMSSDLILDEVDGYNAEDFTALGKLVYLAGLFGRKVIISSATLPPGMAVSFFESYRCGFNLFLKLKGQERDIYSGWFSEYYNESKVIKTKSPKEFRDQHQTIAEKIRRRLEKAKSKRKADLLDIDHCSKNGEVFEIIFNESIKLHKKFSTKDPYTKKKVSIGLIRWNNINTTFDFSKYLFEKEISDIDLKIVCYHAKLLPIVLNETEWFLNNALKRSGENHSLEDSNFFNHKIIRDIIENSKLDDILILVPATSIEELGRDHDFDWLILEPNSQKSVVQCSGRVIRHRDNYPETPNVMVLSQTIRGIHKQSRPFGFPGVQTKDDELSSKLSAEVFNFELMKKNVDASECITESESNSEISRLEHKITENYLIENHASLSNFVNHGHFHLTDYNASINRFRCKEDSLLFWVDNEEGEWHRRYVPAFSKHQEETRSKSVVDDTLELRNKDRSLIQIDIEEKYKYLKNLLFSDSNMEERFCRQILMGIEIQGSKNQHVVYNEVLGMKKKEEE